MLLRCLFDVSPMEAGVNRRIVGECTALHWGILGQEGGKAKGERGEGAKGRKGEKGERFSKKKFRWMLYKIKIFATFAEKFKNIIFENIKR